MIFGMQALQTLSVMLPLKGDLLPENNKNTNCSKKKYKIDIATVMLLIGLWTCFESLPLWPLLFCLFIFMNLAVNISVTGWLVANARLLVSTNQIRANV